jgi:hypothetical protein
MKVTELTPELVERTEQFMPFFNALKGELSKKLLLSGWRLD